MIKKLVIVILIVPLFIACSVEGSKLNDSDNVNDSNEADEVQDADEQTVDEDESVNDENESVDESTDDTVSDEDTAVVCHEVNGIYSVTGEDGNGTYTGTVELRDSSFIRMITYDDLKFEEKTAAQVLEGSVTANGNSFEVDFALDRLGFIYEVGEETREGVDPQPISFSGTFQYDDCSSFEGTVAGQNGTENFSFTEKWQWISVLDTEPIWKNERVEIPTGPEPNETEKQGIYAAYDGFYDREEIKKYKDREDFKKMVHMMVADPTDLEYYRQNPENVRVIQKIVDSISLAEAWMRNDAYRWTLSEKESYFAENIGDVMINELGMIAHKGADGIYYQDGDALLWTGVYVATLAMKYLQTNDPQVLEKMVFSLEGIIACIDIVPEQSEFARTLRLIQDDSDPEFITGIGDKTVNGRKYSEIQWKVNGNNDMAKGPMIAYIWAWFVLRGKSEYNDLVIRMTESLKRMREHSPIFKDTKTNQCLTDFILTLLMTDLGFGYADDRFKYDADGKALFAGVKEYYNSDYIVINEYGVSDWSGNHLGIWGIYNFYTTFAFLGYTDKSDDMKTVLYKAGKDMDYTRQGLYKLISGAMGNPQDLDAVDDGILIIKEIPLNRGKYYVDWTINSSFSLSPIPALFWKMDWETNDRFQSLRSYPIFEKGESSYYWKDNILDGYRGGGGHSSDSGLDFLIAYWFGRYTGIIDSSM